MNEYFVKFIYDASGKLARHTFADPATDVLPLRSIVLGGVTFDETNIVTVTGVNSLAAVSGDLKACILSVSGASSLRNDAQDLLLISVSGDLDTKIDSVSGGSSLRDDSLELLIFSVSGGSSLRDDAQDVANGATHTALDAKIDSVSGASSLRNDFQDLELIRVSGEICDKIENVSGNLQDQITAIVEDTAIEERLFVDFDGQTTFTLASVVMNSDSLVQDVQLFRNTDRKSQSLDGSVVGVSGGDWFKTSVSGFTYLHPTMKAGDLLVVRDERTGGGGGGGGASGPHVDLETITVDTKPAVNGGVALGSTTNAWEFLYLKDTSNSDVYRLEIVSGVFQATGPV